MKNIVYLLLIYFVILLTGCTDKTNKLEEKCNKGIKSSCNKLAEIYETGSELYDVQSDLSKAVHFYQKACENNDFKSCMKVANIYNLGDLESGFEINKTASIIYYKKACAAKYALGCLMLEEIFREKNDEENALYYSKQFENLKQKVIKKTLSEHKIACENSQLNSCEKLGFEYLQGISVDQNFSKAFKYFDKVFTQEGCSFYDNLGLRYENDIYGEEKHLLFEEVWNQGCNVGCTRSCTHLGIYYYNQRIYTKANELLLKGCLNKVKPSAYACVTLSKGKELKHIHDNNVSIEYLLKIACHGIYTDNQDQVASMQACILLGQ